MGEVLCSTENSPFLIIDHIHAKINRVCCAALAIGKRCMNVRENKLLTFSPICRLAPVVTVFCFSMFFFFLLLRKKSSNWPKFY